MRLIVATLAVAAAVACGADQHIPSHSFASAQYIDNGTGKLRGADAADDAIDKKAEERIGASTMDPIAKVTTKKFSLGPFKTPLKFFVGLGERSAAKVRNLVRPLKLN